MEEVLSIGADVCGILAFFVSLFVTSQVLKLRQQVNGNNNNTNSMKGNVGGDFVGRDKKQ